MTRPPSDAADRLEARPGVDLRLRQDRGLRAESLDDRANEVPDAGRGDEDRNLALAGRLLEAVAHQGNELGQAGGLHGEAALLALADNRFGERLLPPGGQRDQRQGPRPRGGLGAGLAGGPGPRRPGPPCPAARGKEPPPAPPP